MSVAVRSRVSRLRLQTAHRRLARQPCSHPYKRDLSSTQGRWCPIRRVGRSLLQPDRLWPTRSARAALRRCAEASDYENCALRPIKLISRTALLCAAPLSVCNKKLEARQQALGHDAQP